MKMTTKVCVMAIVSIAFLAILILLEKRHSPRQRPQLSDRASTRQTQSVVGETTSHARPDPAIKFFAVDNKHGIRFDIFKISGGILEQLTVQANPGDRIGSSGRTNRSTYFTDFDTGWTLVDIREDPAGNTENKILVLTNNAGEVIEHQISLDRISLEYRKLLSDVQAPPAKRRPNEVAL